MTQPNPAPDGEIAALPTATDPSASDSSTVETAEQKAARLETELATERERTENERKLRLSHEQRARDTQQELDRQRAAASPSATADPLAQRIAALREEQAAYRQNNMASPTTDAMLDMALEAQRQREYQAQVRQQQEAAEREFSAMTEDKSIVQKARELFYQGQFASPQIALAHVKAVEAPDLKKQLEEQRKRADDLERDLRARTEGRVSAGSAPVLSVEKPPDPNQKIRVKQSDWDKLDSQPLHVQREWNAAYRAGRLEFINA